ncbi:MAG: hypothetical protein ACKOC5_08365, partial [Chloroflexota bacterium]
MAKMVSLTIDGKSVEVPEGTLVVDAAKLIWSGTGLLFITCLHKFASRGLSDRQCCLTNITSKCFFIQFINKRVVWKGPVSHC